MKSTLSIELLRGLTPKEWRKISYLVHCQYFSTDKYVRNLFEILQKIKWANVVLDDKFQCRLYIAAFSPKSKPTNKLTKNQNSQLNRRLNDLMRIVEKHLMMEALTFNPTCHKMLLYPQLLERKQFTALKRHFNQASKKLGQVVSKGAEYYSEAYQLEQSRIQLIYRTGTIIKEDNLPEIEKNLDLEYILNKLDWQLTATSLSRASIKKQYDFEAMIAIQPLLKLPRYANNPIVMTYLACIELIKTYSDEAYPHTKEILAQFGDNIPTNLLKDFYITLVNYCVAKVNSGETNYEYEIFKIYKKKHENNLLIEGSFMPPRVLKNVVGSSCRVAEYDWAKDIIDYYKKQITPNIRERVCEFNYGTIAFHKGNYEKAHGHFYAANGINQIYDINIRILILKCMYEAKDDFNPAALQNFRTTQKFFKIHKTLSPQKRKGYINFVKLAMHLYRIRSKNAKRIRLEEVKSRLGQYKEDEIIDRSWLIKKINEL